MINLRIAGVKDKELYRNLFNMYHNDLAPYCDDLIEVDDEGYYDKQAVECYFNEDENIIPYVLMRNDKAVGVIVLTRPPYVKSGCDYCIQEFFVLNSFRGKNVAEEVCKQLIDEYKGKYCLTVLNKNTRAINFWKKFTDKYASKVSEGKYDEQSIIMEFSV